jgi:hypothetical protein
MKHYDFVSDYDINPGQFDKTTATSTLHGKLNMTLIGSSLVALVLKSLYNNIVLGIRDLPYKVS